MKKIFSFCFVLLLCFVIVIPTVFAHEEEGDHGVDVTLHIEPNDNPSALSQADLYFATDDDSPTLTRENCLCRISIFDDGKKIFSQDLFTVSPNPSFAKRSLSFVFPKAKVYTIQLQGEPIKAATFSAFTLTWEELIGKPKPWTMVTPIPAFSFDDVPGGYWYAGGGILVLVIGFFIFRRKLSE